LSKLDDADEILSRYGQVIVDECHHLPAFTFESVLKQIPAKYFLGLTATPYRKDGHQAIIHMQCGPTRHEMEDYAAHDLTKVVHVRETPSSVLDSENLRPEIHEVFGLLVDNAERTQMIAKDICKLLDEGRYPLIISERKDHLFRMAAAVDSISPVNRQKFIFMGDLGKKKRKENLETIQKLTEKGEFFYLLATGSLMGEGFDLPILDTVVLAMPISFKGRLIQYAGRIHRPRDGKKDVQIYDYLDNGSGLTISMFKKRLMTYKKMGYRVHAQSGTRTNQILRQQEFFSQFGQSRYDDMKGNEKSGLFNN